MSAETSNSEASRDGSATTPVARQWLINRHVVAATSKHATIEELLEAVFSVRTVPSLYKKETGTNTSTVSLRVEGGDEKGTQCLRV
jgi:hypothetical protein